MGTWVSSFFLGSTSDSEVNTSEEEDSSSSITTNAELSPPHANPAQSTTFVREGSTVSTHGTDNDDQEAIAAQALLPSPPAVSTIAAQAAPTVTAFHETELAGSVHKRRSADLPADIDGTAAVAAFRCQREGLHKLVRHCLPSLANALYAQFLIPEDARERATSESVGTSERSVALLDCLEARSEALPADFVKIVQILESEPFLETIAVKLVQSYLSACQPTNGSLPKASTTIHLYSSYLKALYKSTPISLVNKWPPTPSKEYVQLALVQDGGKCREKFIGHVLKGKVRDILCERNEISMEQILDSGDSEEKKKLILIEGAPGIGKSTFAWELCRKWEELACMTKFSLVVLLRLREKRIQKITEISNLFQSCGASDYKSVSKEVSQNHGSGVLFILDGFDELTQSLQHEGFLMDLITKTVLPESTVVVTSRPSATAELLTSCRPLIWKHIEILGFTQESVEAYAATIFSDPSELERFKRYISASKNPAINSLMYVPINAAIVVQIFRESKSKGTLPCNLTQLYTQLCLTILNKHMKTEQHSTNIQIFEDLSCDLREQFVELSKIAFEGITTQQVIFHNVNLSCHFGFLDSVSSLYGGGEISYNFLHLTLQEFFAAYYISLFPDKGVQLYNSSQNNLLDIDLEDEGRLNIVWRFVAGLTKFEILKSTTFYDSFIKQNGDVNNFFIQCLFEANTPIDFQTIFGTRTCEVDACSYCFISAFDMFALGYCIANCSTKESSWIIKCGCYREFIQGLMTSRLEYGTIEQLYLSKSIGVWHRRQYKFIDMENFLKLMTKCTAIKTMTHFSLISYRLYCANVLLSLSELIPHLTSLKKLEVVADYYPYDIENEGQGMVLLFQKLLYSNVTSLTVHGTEIESICKLNASLATSLCALLHPLFGTLQDLVIISAEKCNGLIKLVSQPSSLQHLSLSGCDDLCTFNTSNYLVKLTMKCDLKYLLKDVVRIIEESQELREMILDVFYDDETNLKAITSALKKNGYLQALKLSCKLRSGERTKNYAEVIDKLSKIDSRVIACNLTLDINNEICSYNSL